MYLTFFWAALPAIAFFLLLGARLPDMSAKKEEQSRAASKKRTKALALCTACIFLGSAAENTMSNWMSTYMENALSIPKIWGDIFGVALFAAVLAVTRSIYAKFGKNIINTLLFGMSFSAILYVVVALSPSAALSIVAAVATGIATSMLWPGTLIMMEENVSGVGVAAYALMAAGGDLGAAIVPQALGIVVDGVSATQWAENLSLSLSITAEQLAFKVGIFCVAVFPLAGALLLIYIKKFFKKTKANLEISDE